jgi:hypothetical protein
MWRTVRVSRAVATNFFSQQEHDDMSAYTVANKTAGIIWWRDGAWTSGDVPAGQSKNVETNHDANVTMFSKSRDGTNTELGFLWIPQNNGCCVVRGKWDWTIKEGLNQNQCSTLG